MPRKISTGFTGGPVLGVLRTVSNTISPNSANQSITIEPTGTGQTVVEGNLQINTGGTVRFSDADNSNNVSLTAPSLSGDVSFTLPAADGSGGQVLVTDGSGALSFASINLPITNDNASSSAHYLLSTTSTSGNATGVTVSSSGLSFVPSTGTLSCTVINETSSITLKENLNPIENALDKILQLNAFTYDRKDGSYKNEAGLIAEQVNEILPNIVRKNEKGEPESISYTRLTAYLIEAVKSMSKEIADLKKTK